MIRRDRGLIRIAGRDRIKWLQGLVTAELTTIAPGAGCFAAACTRQGKMVGVMAIRIFEDHLLLETDPESIAPLHAHFERHLIMEEVTLEDVSARWAVFESPTGGPPVPWFHFVPWGGGFLSTNRALSKEGATRIVPVERAGPSTMSEEEYEARRIENGFPRWGRDMGPEELPMEANLEPLAISYTKGCYLGQEVILRVKNFSEPPKRLMSLAIEGKEAPLAGSPIRVAGEEVGIVTSSSPQIPVALGYVKKAFRKAGTRVEVAGSAATVLDPPWHRFAEKPPDRPASEVGRV